MRQGQSLTVLFVMLAGLIGWSLHFTIMYGGATLACLSLPAQAPLPFRIGAAAFSIVLLGALAALAVRLWRSRRSDGSATLKTFVANGTIAIAVLSVVAIAWVTLPLLLLAECRG